MNAEDDVAFPQEEYPHEETGRNFFAEQTYTAAAVDKESGKVYGLHIGEKPVSDCLVQGKERVYYAKSSDHSLYSAFYQETGYAGGYLY